MFMVQLRCRARGVLVAYIKGTVLVDTINAINTRAGDAALTKIIGNLSSESRAIFEKPVQPSNWYSLDAFVELLEVSIRDAAGGDRSILAKRSEQIVERQLRGVYKVFVKFGSPGFIINRISAVHATYFRGVQIIPEIDANRAIIRYMGFERQHAIMQETILGFFRKALEISGAKDVTLKFTVPITQGAAYSELEITWA
jgi:hypothetical protein